MPFFIARHAASGSQIRGHYMSIITDNDAYATRAEAEQSLGIRERTSESVTIVEAKDMPGALRAAFQHFTGRPMPEPPPREERQGR